MTRSSARIVCLAACGLSADSAGEALGPALAAPAPVVLGLRSQANDEARATATSGTPLAPNVVKKALLLSNGGEPSSILAGATLLELAQELSPHRSMTHALVSELVAIIRHSLRDPARPLAPALTRALEAGGFPFVGAEVEEIARRARGTGATDEELGLSIGAVLALSQRRTGIS